jgi:hypothetical protein
MHAAPDVLGRLHLEMRLELVAEVIVRAVAREQAADPRDGRA